MSRWRQKCDSRLRSLKTRESSGRVDGGRSTMERRADELAWKCSLRRHRPGHWGVYAQALMDLNTQPRDWWSCVTTVVTWREATLSEINYGTNNNALFLETFIFGTTGRFVLFALLKCVYLNAPYVNGTKTQGLNISMYNIRYSFILYEGGVQSPLAFLKVILSLPMS